MKIFKSFKNVNKTLNPTISYKRLETIKNIRKHLKIIKTFENNKKQKTFKEIKKPLKHT